MYCDGWVFDTRTDTIRQIIQPTANSFKFNSDKNQSFMTSQGSVIAQIEFKDTQERFQIGFVEFDRKSD